MGTHVRVANNHALAHSNSAPLELGGSSRICRALQPFSLSLLQFSALEILNHADEPQPHEVFRRELGIAQDRSVLLAVCLHDRGFLVRRTSPESPHAVTLQITALGRAILEAAMLLVYHCHRKGASSTRDS
jgi:DNA-binding MarR family transcriptional regulator